MREIFLTQRSLTNTLQKEKGGLAEAKAALQTWRRVSRRLKFTWSSLPVLPKQP
jgi:hypothetical protein